MFLFFTEYWIFNLATWLTVSVILSIYFAKIGLLCNFKLFSADFGVQHVVQCVNQAFNSGQLSVFISEIVALPQYFNKLQDNI